MKKPFEGRRPAAEFEELRSAGLLRKLRVDRTTGTYFAFTPAAFRERDAILASPAPSAPQGVDSKWRPEAPPPELSAARSRLEVLDGLGDEAKAALNALLGVSTIRPTIKDGGRGDIVFVPMHPWLWNELAPSDRPLLGVARDAGERWLLACRTTLASAGPEHLEDFDEPAESIRRIYVRGSRDAGPLSETTDGNRQKVDQPISWTR